MSRVPARRDGGEADFTPIRAKRVPRPWRWASAVLVTLIAIGILNALVTNPNFRWDMVGQYLFDERVIRGVGWTLLLTVCAMAIAITLAITLAIMRRSPNAVMRAVSWAYIWFFRGTPIYTQLVFWGLITVLYPRITLGVPLGPEFFTITTRDYYSAAIAAIIGLGLNEAAYLSEIVRSGLASVDRGQEEAAKALGMKDGQIMRRIVLPQAMRVIIPPTGNETISMLKTTSLVLAVPFTLELTFATNQLGSQTYLPVPMLVIAAIWYLTITSILMVGQHFLEQHFAKGFAERKGGHKPDPGEIDDTALATFAYDDQGRPINPPRG